MIRVINVKNEYSGDMVYIGRKSGKYRGSVLGNRFKIGLDGDRNEVVRKYKRWVWEEYKKGGVVKDEIDRLVELVKGGGDLKLGCWCHPKPCHGQVIIDLVGYIRSL
jgi:hypothetical protein